MKTYKPPIGNHKYKLSATQEIREALQGLGFENVDPRIDRGCHWGIVYFFDENLERARRLMDPNDRMFRIETPTRFFYVSPYINKRIPERVVGEVWRLKSRLRILKRNIYQFRVKIRPVPVIYN